MSGGGAPFAAAQTENCEEDIGHGMEALDRARRIYRLISVYGTLTDTPADRLKSLLFTLFAADGLPNILLGFALSATISYWFGETPAPAALAGWTFFVLSLVNYIVAQEVITAAKAAAREFDDEPRGIH